MAIITNNEEALRVKCSDVLPEEVGSIVDLLEKELEHSERMGRPGIGLAAPQIGIAKNIAIIRINDHYKINLVNCKIKDQYDLAMFKDEGCLSFPGRVENTMRYQEILIANNLVEPNSFILTGLPSVVVQHELGHMLGILLPDVAIKKKILVKSKLRPNDLCLCGKQNPPLKFKRCCGK